MVADACADRCEAQDESFEVALGEDLSLMLLGTVTEPAACAFEVIESDSARARSGVAFGKRCSSSSRNRIAA